MRVCPDCRSEHMGPPCGGLSFRDRIRTVRLDTSAVPTRSRANYFDSEALDDAFGEDRVESYWEDTAGHGAIHRGPDGELYHRDRSGEVKVASDKVLSEVMDAQEAADVV